MLVFNISKDLSGKKEEKRAKPNQNRENIPSEVARDYGTCSGNIGYIPSFLHSPRATISTTTSATFDSLPKPSEH